MSSCKELPSNKHLQHDQFRRLCKQLYSDIQSNPIVYRGLPRSLLAHLALFGVFFISFLILPEKEQPAPQPRVIPIKLVMVKVGSKPLWEAEHSANHNPTEPAELQLASFPHTPIPTSKPNVESQDNATVKSPLLQKVTHKGKTAVPLKKKIAQQHSASAPVDHAPSAPFKATQNIDPKHSLYDSGSEIGNSAESEKMLRNYEQMISLWLYRRINKKGVHPGEAVLRISINRQGEILLSEIDRSSGYKSLDNAVMAMVKQSSPVPPVPPEYTMDDELEFLLTFRVIGSN